jgi:hypothetical protein
VCSVDFEKNGWIHIPGFIPQSLASELESEMETLLDNNCGFHSYDSHNVYQEDPDPSFRESHTRNCLQRSEKTAVDYANLVPSSPLRKIYYNESLRELVRVCVGLEKLHLSACPFNAAYYNRFEPGNELGWHFDRSSFGVNLVLQPADSGGDFEFSHNTRSDEDMHSFDKVQRTLDGNAEDVIRVGSVGPGSLIIFNGRHSLHRVTPVTIGRRMNAILTYEQKCGQKLNAYGARTFFGRNVDEK